MQEIEFPGFYFALYCSLINNLSYKHIIFQLAFETQPVCVS